MKLIKKIEKYIADHQLLEPDEKVIVGVSGGADSMALLHILISIGYQCLAAHCNFHLRGEESNRDEYFVQSYCKKNNIEYISTSFDTFAYMKKQAVSLEMAARELRYNRFEEISEKYGISKIAVAHHLDDSVETFFINLIRGSGIKGLAGISPMNGKIIRPLLCLTRQEILEYLKINNLKYVEDSTNNQDIYLRNKIRLNIIPQLREINPSIDQTINQTSLYLGEVEKIYSEYANKAIKQIFQDEKINIQLLLKHQSPKAILFEILHPYGFNSTSIENIFESVNSISGKTFYSGDYQLIKDREYFILRKKEIIDNKYYLIDENVSSIKTPIELKIKYTRIDENFQIKKDKNIIYINKSALIYPLSIRRWEKGDRFIPFGMTGSKKVSDYFSDNKFSITDKEVTWLLCNADNKIIWIIGERSDNRFRISEKNDDIVIIEYIPH